MQLLSKSVCYDYLEGIKLMIMDILRDASTYLTQTVRQLIQFLKSRDSTLDSIVHSSVHSAVATINFGPVVTILPLR